MANQKGNKQQPNKMPGQNTGEKNKSSGGNKDDVTRKGGGGSQNPGQGQRK